MSMIRNRYHFVIGAVFVAAKSVFATDLDGDGDADVLSASAGDDKIAWYENLGSGSFGPQQVITTAKIGLDQYANRVFVSGCLRHSRRCTRSAFVFEANHGGATTDIAFGNGSALR